MSRLVLHPLDLRLDLPAALDRLPSPFAQDVAVVFRQLFASSCVRAEASRKCSCFS